MFTTEQIKDAHSKVKSGADFPAYILELKNLGIVQYETWVTNGQTNFFGANDSLLTWPSRYAALTIHPSSNAVKFKADLKAHQQGNSDYPTFCADAASSGIEKWVVDMANMTCSYFDLAGNTILVEEIRS